MVRMVIGCLDGCQDVPSGWKVTMVFWFDTISISMLRMVSMVSIVIRKIKMLMSCQYGCLAG